MAGEMLRWFYVIILGLSSVCIVSEVRRAWRIIPPAMEVPMRWNSDWPTFNQQPAWVWPKSVALAGVGGIGLAFNGVIALVTQAATPDPPSPLRTLLVVFTAIGAVVFVAVKLRMAIADLRRKGRQLRE